MSSSTLALYLCVYLSFVIISEWWTGNSNYSLQIIYSYTSKNFLYEWMNELMHFRIYIQPMKTVGQGSSTGVYSPTVAHVSFVRRCQPSTDEGNYFTSHGVTTGRLLAQIIIGCCVCLRLIQQWYELISTSYIFRALSGLSDQGFRTINRQYYKLNQLCNYYEERL